MYPAPLRRLERLDNCKIRQGQGSCQPFASDAYFRGHDFVKHQTARSPGKPEVRCPREKAAAALGKPRLDSFSKFRRYKTTTPSERVSFARRRTVTGTPDGNPSVSSCQDENERPAMSRLVPHPKEVESRIV